MKPESIRARIRHYEGLAKATGSEFLRKGYEAKAEQYRAMLRDEVESKR